MDTIEALSDSIIDDDSNSHSKLIEVQHIGVTAKLRTPLRNLLASTSLSNESEQETLRVHGQHTTYDKFSNSSHMETETETSKVLYEMRSSLGKNRKEQKPQKLTPTRIEFQLYRKPLKTKTRKQRRVIRKPKLCSKECKEKTVFQRLASFTTLICTKSHKKPQSPRKAFKSASPLLKFEQETHHNRDTQTLPADVRLGIYYFEHGCNDYLRTTDCHPEILSDLLAAKATHCATRFWAEVFGSLHIAVAFVVAFFLQSYRFVLYSLINTLLVGFLHMSSDYFIKPLLTVIFNGFLQPVLIFMHNILSSVRDILAPVADNCNNFMKPLATLGKSIRLVDVNYAAGRKTEKEV